MYRTVCGNVFDSDGTPPGDDFGDSIIVQLTVPDGAGSTVTRSATVDPGGYFEIDSIAVGVHDLKIIYLPGNDTLSNIATLIPAGKHYGVYRLSSDLW